MVRQILCAVSQFEKTTIVWKLRDTRDRKRAANGNCEGRKSHAEAHPKAVELAQQLRRKPRQGKRDSFRNTADGLATQGFKSVSGKPFSPSAIESMI